MSDDRRLVYSTEHGSLDKPMQKKAGKKRRRVATATTVMNNPNKQGIRIRRESKGRGGKTVSVVDGLPLDDAALKKLLKQLKGSLGITGTVYPLTSNK
jgi:translation initiation factor 1